MGIVATTQQLRAFDTFVRLTAEAPPSRHSEVVGHVDEGGMMVVHMMERGRNTLTARIDQVGRLVREV